MNYDIEYLEQTLDPWIKPFVLRLIEEGVETYESCDGGPDHSFPEPTIRFHGPLAEGYRVMWIALALGWPVNSVRRVWQCIEKEFDGPRWEITLYRKKSSRSLKSFLRKKRT